MKLKEEILKKYSKPQCLKIVEWVGNTQKRFDELFALFISDEYRVAQQSSWPLSYSIEENPFLIEKHFKKLLENLQNQNAHNAIKRNTLRLLQFVTIPVDYHGEIMNSCFAFIQSMQEKPSVKSFALAVLDNLAKQYPEIRQELHLIIEEQMPYESPAFKSRGKKIIAKK